MFGLETLDVAIGMIFIFLMLSLVCSAVVEIIEAWLKHRATDLERGIRELLREDKAGASGGNNLVEKLYNHPLVYGLFNGDYVPATKRQGIFRRTNLPSYIPSRNFALALMDIVLPATPTTPSGASGADSPPAPATGANGSPAPVVRPLQPLRDSIGTMQNDHVRRALMTVVDAAGDDVGKARENIESWYNASMDRVSGWYKRRTKKILIFLGFGIAIGMNVNAIRIADQLTRNPMLRAVVVAQAGSTRQQPLPSTVPLEDGVATVKKLGLPIGWDDVNFRSPENMRDSFNIVLLPLFGWSITAFAITFGAPFWFDLLNKFMVIRSTVKPHEKSPEEGSED